MSELMTMKSGTLGVNTVLVGAGPLLWSVKLHIRCLAGFMYICRSLSHVYISARTVHMAVPVP